VSSEQKVVYSLIKLGAKNCLGDTILLIFLNDQIMICFDVSIKKNSNTPARTLFGNSQYRKTLIKKMHE
jgi:hypothetical protein